MFASETSGQDPKPHSPVLVPPESDIFVSITERPPDPLLESGAFINANITSGETLTGADTFVQDHDERDADHNNQTPPETETEPMQVPKPSDNVNGESSFISGTPNDVEFATPVPLNAAFPAKTPMRRGRRKKSDIIGMELATVSISSVKPEWLPTGWYVEDRVRTSGASAGAMDKYYCDPTSGFKFRSRQEVIYFQQTGSRRKRVLKEKTSDDVTASLGSSGNRKEKKIRSRTKTQASNFDFVNVPEKIGWVLTHSAEGSWTPFVGDEKVSETSKEEWAATFSSLATRNSGC